MSVGSVGQKQAGGTRTGARCQIHPDRHLPTAAIGSRSGEHADIHPAERLVVNTKDVQIRFEQAPSLEDIEVLIRAAEQDPQVLAMIRRLSDSPVESISVFDRHEIRRVIPMEDIISINADGKQVNVVTEDDSYYTRQTLKNLESILDERRFVRVSRYEIVNISKVVGYDFTVAGTLRLELAGGMETWASRRCIPQIRRRLLGKG